MKILSVGDLLLGSADMKAELAGYPRVGERFDRQVYGDFGPKDRHALRAYIKKMEQYGFDCEKPGDEIYGHIVDAEVLQIHLCPVPGDLIKAAKSLRFILSNRGGLENIDLRTAKECGVNVLYNPAHNANAVAELTVGLMLAESRNIARAHYALKHGEWREKYPNSSDIPELDGAVAGLVGLGTIGHLVAQKLSCFNCGILVYDPYTPKEKIEGCGYRYAESLNSLLEQADYVSLHARVTDETRGMMGDDEFKRMKSSAVLINTARPALVDTGALCRALENNIIRGAAVDVFDQEPVDPDNPLLKLDNITLTNHRGGDTTNSYKKSPGMLYRELERYYAGETPRFFIPALQEANQWSY